MQVVGPSSTQRLPLVQLTFAAPWGTSAANGGPIEMKEQLIAGGTAFAGLILVFLGASVSAFGSYAKEQQASVKAKFKARALLAFAGRTLSLAATTSGLFLVDGGAKAWECVGVTSLALAMAVVFLCGLQTLADVL